MLGEFDRAERIFRPRQKSFSGGLRHRRGGTLVAQRNLAAIFADFFGDVVA